MDKNKSLTAFLKNVKFAGALKYAYYTQKEIERQIKVSLKNNLSFHEKIHFSNEKNNFLESIRKNFFSLLMISVLKNIGINHGRVREYGKIIFGLKSITTHTDNMIVNNTLLLMISQDIIRQALIVLEDQKGVVMNRLLENIHSITSSESLRDLEKHQSYPKPEYVSKNIHHDIGGELLALALTTPIFLEEDTVILEKLQLVKNAILMIGKSFQELDDLCDMKEDFFNKKVNLALSILHYNYNCEIDSETANIKPESKEFQPFYENYVKTLIENALEGFELLESLGYPLNRQDAFVLLKYLFRLKNLDNYWKFYEETLN